MDRCKEFPWGTCGTCGVPLGMQTEDEHPTTGDLACRGCAADAREAINLRAMQQQAVSRGMRRR